MSEQNNQYDEITFALYYDHELDAKEAKLFEMALEQNEQLMKTYDQWVDAQEAVSQYLEDKEAEYQLEGFSDRVMKALPADPNWKVRSEQQEVVSKQDSNQQTPWWQSWFTPMLVGGLVAAALILVIQGLQESPVQNQRSTILINQAEQGDKAPVIWLLDEEDEQEQDNEDEQEQDGEDI
jgi:hypothetical protein